MRYGQCDDREERDPHVNTHLYVPVCYVDGALVLRSQQYPHDPLLRVLCHPVVVIHRGEEYQRVHYHLHKRTGERKGTRKVGGGGGCDWPFLWNKWYVKCAFHLKFVTVGVGSNDEGRSLPGVAVTRLSRSKLKSRKSKLVEAWENRDRQRSHGLHQTAEIQSPYIQS